ncbi:hypothetical protein HDV05_008254 [Chytridiales sp. JEL 0842]|nr:hypothetical protein HDV05_008254 [Chytridiales sp. JEL 0842]
MNANGAIYNNNLNIAAGNNPMNSNSPSKKRDAVDSHNATRSSKRIRRQEQAGGLATPVNGVITPTLNYSHPVSTPIAAWDIYVDKFAKAYCNGCINTATSALAARGITKEVIDRSPIAAPSPAIHNGQTPTYVQVPAQTVRVPVAQQPQQVASYAQFPSRLSTIPVTPAQQTHQPARKLSHAVSPSGQSQQYVVHPAQQPTYITSSPTPAPAAPRQATVPTPQGPIPLNIAPQTSIVVPSKPKNTIDNYFSKGAVKKKSSSSSHRYPTPSETSSSGAYAQPSSTSAAAPGRPQSTESRRAPSGPDVGVMTECPVCMTQLYPTAESTQEEAEEHVARCLSSADDGSLVAGVSSSSPNDKKSTVVVGGGSQYVDYIVKDGMAVKECVICFEDMRPGNVLVRMDCFCVYHKHCVEGWFQRKKSCPVHAH